MHLLVSGVTPPSLVLLPPLQHTSAVFHRTHWSTRCARAAPVSFSSFPFSFSRSFRFDSTRSKTQYPRSVRKRSHGKSPRPKRSGKIPTSSSSRSPPDSSSAIHKLAPHFRRLFHCCASTKRG